MGKRRSLNFSQWCCCSYRVVRIEMQVFGNKKAGVEKKGKKNGTVK